MSHQNVTFKWTPKRQKVAVLLAQGYTIIKAAEEVGISQRQVYRWKADLEFEAEVDRLSLMVDIASRAQRLRTAMKVVREKIQKAEQENKPASNADLLDWLKYAQSETNGVRLGLAQLFEETIHNAQSQAGIMRPDRTPRG